MFKHTKIVATLGPSCHDAETLEQMVKAGLNCARLNFSHGSYDDHRELYNTVRAVEAKLGVPVTIIQDLQGPKIRVGVMPKGGLEVKDGDEVVFDTAVKEYENNHIIPVDFSDLHLYLKPGERLLVNDGRIETKIEKVEGTRIYTTAIDGGPIESHKGINLPDSNLPISSLTEKDKEDLRFGVELGVDMVAISFVNSAQDVIDTRYLIRQYEEELGLDSEYPIRIIAKIERKTAVDNIAEIVDATDAIMVARGDMGVEMRAAEVPLIQKKLIDAANAAAKPVIVATQMLDSMQANRRPTRAEVSDVANAVIDHADAVMLSNETAVGKFPVLTVKTMADIVVTAEKSEYDDAVVPVLGKKETPVDFAIAQISRLLAEEVGAKLILAASITGETGRLISRMRPSLQIMVATPVARIQRQLVLSWGVNPFILPSCRTIEELVERSINYIKTEKIAKAGDTMIVVAGEPVGQAGHVNLVEVREIK